MREELTKRINVRVSETEKKQLVEVCNVLQIDQSDVVRKAVKKELNKFAKANPTVKEILGIETATA